MEELHFDIKSSQFHQHFTRGFYVRMFLVRNFFVLRFKVRTFWRKNIGAKAAHIMLMKLTQVAGCKMQNVSACGPQ